MPDGWPWPRISIVTPSYNQGQFIEETVRSVLLQSYPNLEYIIIDGGSTDNSVEIIQKYEPWLAYWVSEQDSGQTNALNKGFARSNGVIFGFLNSDDLLCPGTLQRVATEMARLGAMWLSGGCYYHEEGQTFAQAELKVPRPTKTIAQWLTGDVWLPQRSTFWRSDLARAAGSFREDMHYAFDNEYWIRLLLLGYNYHVIQTPLAIARLHTDCKTVALPEAFHSERARIREAYIPLLSQEEMKLLHLLDNRKSIQAESGDILKGLDSQQISRYMALHAAFRIARQYGFSALTRPYLGMLRRILFRCRTATP